MNPAPAPGPSFLADARIPWSTGKPSKLTLIICLDKSDLRRQLMAALLLHETGGSEELCHAQADFENCLRQ